MRALPGMLLVLLLVLCASSVAHAETRHFAVIVAHSQSLDGEAPPLEYADDDAARYAEMFEGIAERVELVAVLDEEIQALYPHLTSRARKPDRETTIRTLESVFSAIRDASGEGDETVLYFILIGHGEIAPGGEGFVSLLDGKFTRSDLYERVIGRSPATFNHIIVDACNSYFMVNRRGGGDAGPSRADAIRRYVNAQDLSAYPNTGALVSTSAAKESHEWSGYQAGVFSHELRSALSGAADANGDGRVDYSEVHAFIAAANEAVDDPRARVEVFVEPPSIDVRRPVVDLRAAKFDNWLSIPGGREAGFFLEDDRGVRYADVHVSGESPTYLALVPRSHYFVRSFDGNLERRVELSSPGRVLLSLDGWQASSLRARGSVGASFQNKLFRSPYGLTFYRGFAAANGYSAAPTPEERWRPSTSLVGSPAKRANVWAWSALGTSALLVAGGVVAHVQSAHAVSEWESQLDGSRAVSLSRQEAESLEQRARNWAWARNGMWIGAGVLAGVATVSWLLRSDEPASSDLRVGAMPTAEGALFSLGGSF